MESAHAPLLSTENRRAARMRLAGRRLPGTGLRGRRLFKVEKQFWRDKFLDFYGKMQDFHKISKWLGVHSKWWVQQQRKHACPGSV